MNTIQVNIGSKKQTLQLPSEWNELSAKQLLFVASLFTRGLVHPSFVANVALEMLGKKHIVFKEYRRLQWLIATNKHNLAKYSKADDMLTDLNYAIAVIGEQFGFIWNSNKLTRQLLPKYRGKYGPSDFLGNLTLIEFSKAEVRFKAYEQTKNELYLNQLVAILYRKPKFFWFIRRHFSADIDPRREYSDNYIRAGVSSWPLNVRFAIYLWYQGCRQELAARYPNVFTEGDGDSDDFGFASLITSLAGPKFGDTDKTASTLLHTILAYLELQAREANKNKQKTEAE